MTCQESESRPAGNGPASKSLSDSNLSVRVQTDIAGLTPEQSRILHNWIADANSKPAERLAYVAVVEIAEGKYRRRPYLTLAAAQRAVDRAEARGVTASVTLCELVPVRGDVE